MEQYLLHIYNNNKEEIMQMARERGGVGGRRQVILR